MGERQECGERERVTKRSVVTTGVVTKRRSKCEGGAANVEGKKRIANEPTA